MSLLLAHLLAAYAAFAEPVLGRRMYTALKRSLPEDRSALSRLYRQGLLLEWAWMVVLALVLISGGFSPADIGLVWTAPSSQQLTFFAAVLFGSLIPVAVFSVRSLRSGQSALRVSLQRMLELVSALLPRTSKERWLFAALAITAGVCEEILFRGFLIFYFQQFLGLQLVLAVAISAVIFGTAHLYQGLKGVFGTGLFGLAMAILYAASGSLLLPIVLHALMDLRILLFHRSEPRTA